MTFPEAHHTPVRALAAALLTAACLALSPVASMRTADSDILAAWHPGDADVVAVDGSMADWSRLVRVSDGPAVAARNDTDTLYLAVASNDETVRLQLATGLVVWIDAAGRRAQTFGLRLEGLADRPLPGAAPVASAADALARDLSGNSLDAFDLLGPGRNQRRLVDNPGDIGLALALGVEDGTIVYELAVPLTRTATRPHAVGAGPGATVALGLETPSNPRPPRSRNRLDDPMNTNPWIHDPYGGFFNPLPPPGARSAPPPREVVIKPMKIVWAQLELAAAPAPSGQ